MTGGAPALTVVGAINLDIVATTQRAPVPGETVADGVLSKEPGGKGANQAVAAARLGASVRMVGAVGRDADGQALVGSMSSLGVDVSGVQEAAAATGTALIVVDASGENSIVVCPGANAEIDPDALVLDPDLPVLAQLEVPLPVIERAAAMTRGLFVLNAAPAVDLSPQLIERVDVFVVNQTEYAQLPWLREAAMVVLTLGGDGAVLLEHGAEVARAAGIPTTVVSTVGAGDAFCAAFTLGLVRGDDPSHALATACRVGAAAVADRRSQPLLHTLDDYR